MRLDAWLVSNGLISGRERAAEEIRAGCVTVNGTAALKPSQSVDGTETIRYTGAFDYVSRGAKKLIGALECFPIEPEGKVCLDCGASTGGFTEVLLRRGARMVYAVDVGSGQLADKLKQDKRVVNMENRNARELSPEDFEKIPEIATCDLSFISLRLILGALVKVVSGDIICLIKPQFEAGPAAIGKRGVVRDAAVHERVLKEFCAYSADNGLCLCGMDVSPIRGPEGNVEFLAWLNTDKNNKPVMPDIKSLVERAKNVKEWQ